MRKRYETGDIKMLKKNSEIFVSILVFIVCLSMVDINETISGITGKIAGRVIDAETKDALPGANILIEGTTLGAATNHEGNYFIINIPPGRYTVVCQFMGYGKIRKTEVIVSTNLTTEVNFDLNTEVIFGQTVTVVAERHIIQKDVTGSQMIMREEDLKAFSQDAFSDFLGTLVGISISATEDGTGMSIRGGDIAETNVLINGVSTRNAFTSQANLGISLTSIKEVSITTGGFTAEHGEIRSGLVNVITKEGTRDGLSLAVDLRIGPAQKKLFGANPYSVNSPIWQVYSGPKAFTGVTKADVENGDYPFEFVGWDRFAEQKLTDSDPNNNYTPQQWMEQWRWTHRNIEYANKPDYILDGSIGGSFPLGNATFLLSQHYENLQLALPYSRTNSIQSTSQANITFRITPSIKLTTTNLFTLERGVSTQNDNYSFGMVTGSRNSAVLARNIRWEMLYNPYGINPMDRKTILSGFNWTHAVSPSTFYNISMSGSYFKGDQGIKKYRDTTKNILIGNVWMDEAPEGYSSSKDYKDMFDQFWLHRGGGQIDDSEYKQIRIKGILESQLDYRNQVKIGFEGVYTDYNMQAAQIQPDQLEKGNYSPPYFIEGSVPSSTFYFKNKPLQLSTFIQDKIEYEGMIANLGFRMDYFNPRIPAWDVSEWNDYYFDYDNWRNDIGFAQMQTGGNAVKYKFSPRLGVSFPTTESSKFYFNYGHFYQLPVPHELFNINLGSASPPFRIPNLNAEWPRTVQYEVGFEKALSNIFLFRISAYYKDVTNQLSRNGQTWIDNNLNELFETQANTSYEDIRGIEIRLRQRTGRFGYGWIDFEYQSISEGNTGYERVHLNPQYADEQKFETEQQRNWPVPRLSVVYSFRLPKGFGPTFIGSKPLSDWSLQVNGYWRDGGKRIFDSSVPLFARQYIDAINRHNVDLLVRKGFEFKELSVFMYMRVRNLTNTKGRVYWRSGNDYRSSLHLPWLEGDLKGNDKYYEGPGEENPWIDVGWQWWRNYINPRHVMFGVELNFR